CAAAGAGIAAARRFAARLAGGCRARRDRRPGRPRTRLRAGACGGTGVGRGSGRRGVPRPLTQAGFFLGPCIFLSGRRNRRGCGRSAASGARRGAPGQAAVSLAAIVASFSLMAAMAIMVASFRQSVDDWLNTVLPAELYLRTSHAGDTGYLEPGFEERVRALPQVARADFLRSGRILLDPSRPPLVLIARDRAEKAFPKVGRQYLRRADDPAAVWISEAVGDLYGFSPGQKIQLPVNGQSITFVVAGAFRDYARQHGSVLIDRADYA